MADTYTIQFRRGMYADFDTSKIRPGEPVAILGNDPSVPSGKALYIAFAANDVRRLCSIEDISEMVNAGEFVGPQGPKGDKGDVGPQGPKGEKGDAGPKGDSMSDEQVVQLEQNKKDINSLKEDKVDKPTFADDGKIPRAKGGGVEWVEVGQPTDEQTNNAVTGWLNEHPEATTTVQDGSLTKSKFALGLMPYNKFNTMEEAKGKISPWEIFEINSFYRDDGLTCRYLTVPEANSIGSNSVKLENNLFVAPIFSYNKKRIELDSIGLVKDDESKAKFNSDLLETFFSGDKPLATYESDAYFGCGTYYFDRPIKISGYAKVSLHGVSTGTKTGATILVFKNLLDGDTAITAYNLVENITIIGNAESYNCVINRKNTYVNPDAIVNETKNITAKAITLIGSGIIKNCCIKNFYYGVFCETANIQIENIYGYNCNTVISVGNDTHCNNIYGWDVMCVVECRSFYSSFSIIRGDSIGEHLIKAIKGNVVISDAFGDYCVKSLVHYGAEDTGDIYTLGTITGLTGRFGAKNAFHASEDFDIKNGDYDCCSAISIAKNNRVTGGSIVLNISIGEDVNLIDDSTDYKAPQGLISIGQGTAVAGLNVIANGGMIKNFNKIDISKSVIFKKIIRNDNTTYGYNDGANKTSILLYTGNDIIKYTRGDINDDIVKTPSMELIN